MPRFKLLQAGHPVTIGFDSLSTAAPVVTGSPGRAWSSRAMTLTLKQSIFAISLPFPQVGSPMVRDHRGTETRALISLGIPKINSFPQNSVSS
jgi:hypothetical protein